MAGEERGEMGYGRPSIADGQLRQVDIDDALDHGGAGPRPLRGFDKGVAVDARPRNRTEEVASADLAGVRTQRGELRGRNASPPRLEARFVEPALDLSIRRCVRQTDLAISSAVAMGKALQITNIMRDVKEDAERGRIYIAQEDLALHGVTEDEILGSEYNDRFRHLMADYAQRAYDFYREGERLIPLLDGPRSRACCNGLQGVYRMILDAIVAREYDVYSQRVSPSKAGRVVRMLELWLRGAMPNVARVG